MTTIVWDGSALVADRQTSCGGMVGVTTKIRRVVGCLIGVCGDGAAIQMFSNWMVQGCKHDEYPKTLRDGDAVAMVIRGDGKVRLYEKEPVPLVLEQNEYAIGSGREFARAAIMCGKTAREAVAIASALDCNSGQGFDELRFTTERIDPND